MRTAKWTTLGKQDKLRHDWADIKVEAVGPTGIKHVGEFRVSASGVKHPTDETIVTCTAEAQQQYGDRIDGLLLTSKLFEVRYVNGTVKCRPRPGDVTKDRDGVRHSKRINKDLQTTMDVKVGQWLVVGQGKTWILDEKCTATRAVNHGWVVPLSETRVLNSIKGTWKGPDIDFDGMPDMRLGIPLSKCKSIPNYMIQNRGGRHDVFYHLDYSQQALYVHGWCVVDGVRMRTSEVYMSKELACLVTFNGKPLPWARQPGVKKVDSLVEEVEIGSTFHTLPSPAVSPWRNPNQTHGHRATLWSLLEDKKGITEEPKDSNNGPRISQYHACTERKGKPGFGAWLAKAGGSWCASFYSFGQKESQLPSDPQQDFKCRASGIELEQDAKANKTWRPAKMVLDGRWLVETGDGVIYKRGTKEWQRHVCRYVRRIDEHHFETVGGNENDHIRLTVRRFDDENLLGFIEQPDMTPDYDAEAMQRSLELDYKELPASHLDELIKAMSKADPADDGYNV